MGIDRWSSSLCGQNKNDGTSFACSMSRVVLKVLLAVAIEIWERTLSRARDRFIFILIRVKRSCWKGERVACVGRHKIILHKTTCSLANVGSPVSAFTFRSSFAKACSSSVPSLVFSLRFSSLRSSHSCCSFAMASSQWLLKHCWLTTVPRGHPQHLVSFPPPSSWFGFYCAAHTFCLQGHRFFYHIYITTIVKYVLHLVILYCAGR